MSRRILWTWTLCMAVGCFAEERAAIRTFFGGTPPAASPDAGTATYTGELVGPPPPTKPQDEPYVPPPWNVNLHATCKILHADNDAAEKLCDAQMAGPPYATGHCEKKDGPPWPGTDCSACIEFWRHWRDVVLKTCKVGDLMYGVGDAPYKVETP